MGEPQIKFMTKSIRPLWTKAVAYLLKPEECNLTKDKFRQAIKMLRNETAPNPLNNYKLTISKATSLLLKLGWKLLYCLRFERSGINLLAS
ncbi:hypothetical protein CQA01_23810 [Cyclobacterium qasimii]|uniref:Uncharacterized protein n=1 Tax=Cyclobacterium qasimii TaxID=1350429 RepID=A0A512CCE1_9BACT|nr:hypothetical protein CQA01_23810 [Cyclobacterium qasimii]